MAICKVCNIEKDNDQFYKRKDKYRATCKECERKSALYTRTLFRSVKKGIEFNLTKEYFSNLHSSRCFYCNSDKKISLDRIDNNLGYSKNNVVACCPICNKMKHTMPVSEFKNKIFEIYSNLKAKD